MPDKFPECAKCIHSDFRMQNGMGLCDHPDVRLFTDDVMHKNRCIWCDSARDIKLMCGHTARWFKSR